MRKLLSVAAAAVAISGAAQAAETTNYTYDARGRLKQVARTGAVNNGVSTTYQWDKAHNRKRKTITGAP